MLQWGHDGEAVERRNHRPAWSAARCCFNGATTVRPWKEQTHNYRIDKELGEDLREVTVPE